MRYGVMALAPGADKLVPRTLCLDVPLSAILDRIVRAETAGFHAVWLPQLFDHDALTVLALAGQQTRRIELGTAVVPTYPRHPTALAQTALTAQAATGNRVVLGIGLSHRFIIEGQLGLDYSKPVRHMREYLTVLNGLLSGERTRFAGEEYRVTTRTTVPGADAPPVLVAALGPQMLRLTGRLAAGTITWLGSRRYLAETAVPIIRQAAAEAGRPEPRIVSGVPVAVTRDESTARQAAAAVFAPYAGVPSYRAVLDREGVPDAAGVAIAGNENAVARQLDELAAAGATDLMAVLYDIPEDPEARERTFEFLAARARAATAATGD